MKSKTSKPNTSYRQRKGLKPVRPGDEVALAQCFGRSRGNGGKFHPFHEEEIAKFSPIK